MGTTQIIKEINRLPMNKRMFIAERILKSFLENETKKKFYGAVNIMVNDYKTNKELTAFTALDAADFYETR